MSVLQALSTFLAPQRETISKAKELYLAMGENFSVIALKGLSLTISPC